MVRAVDQHAGDTGPSHLANRYFFGSLHRVAAWTELWMKKRQPGTRATAEARAGPAELLKGAARHFGSDDNTTGDQRVGSQSRDCASPGSIPFSIRSNAGNRAI